MLTYNVLEYLTNVDLERVSQQAARGQIAAAMHLDGCVRLSDAMMGRGCLPRVESQAARPPTTPYPPSQPCSKAARARGVKTGVADSAINDMETASSASVVAMEGRLKSLEGELSEVKSLLRAAISNKTA